VWRCGRGTGVKHARPYLCRAVNVTGLAVRERSGDMGLAVGRHGCVMVAPRVPAGLLSVAGAGLLSPEGR